ncbi:RNA polymerase sigma factor [Pelagicoccus albus]|uniref:RNA polymerase sigma factor n=1 Tax=Pelagicoccus albus TaxID=415222 RepID=A0A7X1B8H4_9BACT|nr:RNA polymerase sigma factor [Pelagicoccus albus]MBC2607630.1 RNA polymerase sigma factor [Pelagicoccus albus]
MPSESNQDGELMRGLIAGTPGALEKIIEYWERPLFSFVFRYTQNEFAAREIVQETFIRIYQKRERFDFSYPMSSWVFTIAANLCKNRARWRRRHPEVSLEGEKRGGENESGLIEFLPADAETPHHILERQEDLKALKDAVMSLPHDLRTAVLLHHYQEMSYKEIAEVVGCSPRGVETRLYRARKQLRKSLSKGLEALTPDSDILSAGAVLPDFARASV